MTQTETNNTFYGAIRQGLVYGIGRTQEAAKVDAENYYYPDPTPTDIEVVRISEALYVYVENYGGDVRTELRDGVYDLINN